MIFSSVLNRVNRFNKNLFDVSYKEQSDYLDSLGEPKDDIDRSFKQFLCQQYFVPKLVRVILSFLSILLIPIIIIVLYVKGQNKHFEKKVTVIAADANMDEVIPYELSNKFDIHHNEWNAGLGLSNNDLIYIYNRILTRKQPYFILKSIIQIALYSSRITRFKPEILICHSEYSFNSSLVHNYCNHRGVKLLNVMHGEKLFYIRDSFFHFDECYVWDQHYVDLFISLKAEPSQFKIALPPSLMIDVYSNLNSETYSDYKYYLAGDNEEQIRSIVKSLEFIKKENKSLKYRIHPRYTDLEVLRRYVSEEEIEYPSDVKIEESVANVENVLGSYTTVLLQAYNAGKNVILDDVTYKERYEKLKEYRYILANEAINKLSDKILETYD